VGPIGTAVDLGVSYSAFCDPSGGISDAMTLAIGHLDRNTVCILDALLECKPPFDPERAVAECVELLRRYGVATVTGDRYAGEWPVARFREHGIEFVQSARPKSDLYHDLLPLLNARRVELLDNPRLSAQLCGLERRTARSGKDSIDHAPGSHDDLCNAAAGVLVGLDLDRLPALIDIKDLTGRDNEGADRGVVVPRCLRSHVLVVADEGPDIAAVFCGSGVDPVEYPNGVKELFYVLDVDLVYFKPGLFAELARRNYGDGAIAPEHLVSELKPYCHLVGSPTTSFDPDLLLTFTAERIARGVVKLGPKVIERMRSNQAVHAAMSLRAGTPIEGALRRALITAVWSHCKPYSAEFLKVA
jgi:hypothetical protein